MTYFANTSYLSTVMQKVGYCLGQGTTHEGDGNLYTLVNMSDGLTKLGYFDTTKDLSWPNGESGNSDLWTWVPFDSKQAICDYLNDPNYSKEHRFATQEEVVRVVLYQKSRWK